MHVRHVRLGWLGLILSFPLAIEAMSPGTGESWTTVAGRLALVELMLLGGLMLAVRQRRAMQVGWHERREALARAEPSPITVSVAMPPAAPTPYRPSSTPVRVPALAGRNTVAVG